VNRLCLAIVSALPKTNLISTRDCKIKTNKGKTLKAADSCSPDKGNQTKAAFPSYDNRTET